MRECPLHVRGQNHMLESLPEDDKKRLLPAMERVVGNQGDVLFKRNGRITHVYFPLNGVISAVVVMSNGDRVECATIGNEGMAGLPLVHGVDRSRFEIIFQVPGEAMRMSVVAFEREMALNGPLALVARRYAEAFCGLVGQATACNNIHAVEQRLSRLILMAHDRVGSDTIHLKQDFLAQMLGVRRSSVSPVAGLLQRDGLIRYRRGVMVVLKRRELEARSCECYLTVRKEYERLLC
ncbi:MAG TPA: Crp/Fnr family transcriptional regulator [Burkholderiales bacterium]|nr:Crp/Fnr family transcriptional regulator [Burkholderiales bacterium]